VFATIYVEPRFVSKYKEYDGLTPRPGQTVAQTASANVVSGLAAARELAKPGALERTAAVLRARAALAAEMRQFLLEQKCDSATVGQFKENLLPLRTANRQFNS
jgi:hypothetical protein